MKKLVMLILPAAMLAVLPGCHLRHDMLPATCTEPATCSVCGKTEGEPLGHTETADAAVEPTCTETGLTEGSHCEVCGEVLVKQETVEALGHDWEDATFAKPKTCRVCGETEGGPLESELFVDAVNSPLREAELPDSVSELKEETEEEAAAVSLHKEIRISGHTDMLGSADSMINDSSLTLTTDIEDGQAMILADAAISGAKPIRLFVSADKEGIGFTLPGITEEYYRIPIDTLAELYETISSASDGEDGAAEASRKFAEQITELLESEEGRDLLLKYERILFSVFSLGNTTESREEYRLETLEKTQECMVLECHPDAGDWKEMLQSLLKTAEEDKDLAEKVIGPLSEAVYAYDPEVSSSFDSPEEVSEELIKTFRQSVSAAMDETDALAEALAEYKMTVAYDGGRLYGLAIQDKDGAGIFYESFGTPETEREDVLVTDSNEEKMILARSRVSENDGSVTGSISFADDAAALDYAWGEDDAGRPVFNIGFRSELFSLRTGLENTEENSRLYALFENGENEAELEAVIADTEERLEIPEGKVKILSGEDDFQEAADAIAEDVRMAELFGHTWKEATCTEPRTCEVCGETRGKPLGHDWEDADCTEPRTCSRCGETKGKPLGHDWGEWDDDGKRACSRCGETETLFDDDRLVFEDDESGRPRLLLTDEQKEAVQEIRMAVLVRADDNYLMMGSRVLPDSFSEGLFFDGDGALQGEMDLDWVYLNGNPAVFFQDETAPAEDQSYRGYVPVARDDQICYLEISVQNGSVSAGKLLEEDRETVMTLKGSDQIQLIGEFYDSSLDYQGVGAASGTFPYKDVRDFSLQRLTDEEEAEAFYIITDKNGNSYYTDLFTL